MRGNAAIVAIAALGGLSLGGCGGQPQDESEPSGEFPVRVIRASFPSHQSISAPVRMQVYLRNAGRKTIPNIAVTLLDPKHKTSAQAFSDTSSDAELASRSRPIWILDQGPSGGDTAYSNTWALGPLAPGRTKRFRWSVTPARPGHYDIIYRVAAGLNGKAKAVIGGGEPVTGHFQAEISDVPAQATVDAAGNVVSEKP